MERARSGIATIVSGATNVVVEHGLDEAPVLVHVSGADNSGAGLEAKVIRITDREFTLHTDEAPGPAGATYFWRAVNEWRDRRGRPFRDGAFVDEDAEP